MEDQKKSKDNLRIYLNQKVYVFLNPMITELLRDKPDEVVDFMVQWLENYQQFGLQKKENIVQNKLPNNTVPLNPNNANKPPAPKSTRREFSAKQDKEKGVAYQFLKNKVDIVLEKLITDILISTPPDPVNYAIDWFKKKGKVLSEQLNGKRQKSLSNHSSRNKSQLNVEVSDDNKIDKLSFVIKRAATYIKPFNQNLENTIEGQIFAIPKIQTFRKFLDQLSNIQSEIFEKNDITISLCSILQKILKDENRLKNNITVQSFLYELQTIDPPKQTFKRIIDFQSHVEESFAYSSEYVKKIRIKN